MEQRRPFEFVDEVTSDLAVVVRAATLEGVFSAAAEALLAATVENPDAVAERSRCVVRVDESALDLLLLRFLNELIFLRDSEQLLLRPRRVEIRRDDLTEIEAELVGEAIDPARHVVACDVKATTAHGLRVTPTAEGWEAYVTFDV